MANAPHRSMFWCTAVASRSASVALGPAAFHGWPKRHTQPTLTTPSGGVLEPTQHPAPTVTIGSISTPQVGATGRTGLAASTCKRIPGHHSFLHDGTAGNLRLIENHAVWFSLNDLWCVEFRVLAVNALHTAQQIGIGWCANRQGANRQGNQCGVQSERLHRCGSYVSGVGEDDGTSVETRVSRKPHPLGTTRYQTVGGCPCASEETCVLIACRANATVHFLQIASAVGGARWPRDDVARRCADCSGSARTESVERSSSGTMERWSNRSQHLIRQRHFQLGEGQRHRLPAQHISPGEGTASDHTSQQWLESAFNSEGVALNQPRVKRRACNGRRATLGRIC